MPELLLMRHAKSDWGDRGLADHDRPLSGRGRRAAPAVARYLLDGDHLPDRVLCSSSARTRETWALMEEVIDSSAALPELVVVEDLYLASPRTMLDVVRDHGEGADRLMLLGHNPGTQDFAISLCVTGDDHLLDRLERKFPTAGLARIEFRGKGWNAVRPGVGHLVDFVRPTDLPKATELGL